MSQTLPPAPIRSPIVDQRGMVTAPWLQWLRSLYGRVGGAVAPSNNDLSGELPEDAGIEELKASTWTAFDALGSAPLAAVLPLQDAIDPGPAVAEILARQVFLESALITMREEMAEMVKEIDALKSGVLM